MSAGQEQRWQEARGREASLVERAGWVPVVTQGSQGNLRKVQSGEQPVSAWSRGCVFTVIRRKAGATMIPK